jgi:hypothetical protein
LARLASDLPPIEVGPAVELSIRQQRLVLEWYRKHGPLGLLSHVTLLATLHPAWDQSSVEQELPDGSIETFAGDPTPVQRTFTRTPRGWVTREAWFHEHASDGKAKEARAQLEIEQPQVLMTPLDRWEPASFDVAQAWGPFFPHVGEADKEKFQYPRPNTLPFWRQSGEPVELFLRTAHLMQRLVRDIAQRADRHKRALALELLSTLLVPNGVRPSFGTDDAIVMRWEAPSLLATHSIMILMNLMGTACLRVCPTCGKPFVNPKKTYCSPEHSNVFRQKTYREKMRGES